MTRTLMRIAAGLGLLTVSCGTSTYIDGTWRDPEFKGKIKNVLVLGIMDNMDRRRVFESEMKAELDRHGIKSVATLDVMAGDERLDEETFRRYFSEMKIDGVLASRVIAVQGRGRTQVSVNSGPDFYGFYSQSYDAAHHSRSYSASQTVQVETNLYETTAARLIWSAHSSTYDPADVFDGIKSFSKSVVERLSKEKFMPGQSSWP